MKKIGLLMLGCLAIATNAMAAVDWPENYVYTAASGCWFTEPVYAGDDFPRATATAQDLGAEFVVPEDAEAFDAVFESIDGDAYEIDKLRKGQSINVTPAAYKAGYTDDAIYLFVTIDATPSTNQGIEVMLTPFDQLANAPDLPEGVTENFKAVRWMRYLELGGFKVSAILKEGKFAFNDFMGVTNGVAGFLQSSNFPNGTGVSIIDRSSADAVKVIVKVEFYTLDVKDGAEFSKEVWKDASDGKGISFDIKAKKAGDSEYFWNAASIADVDNNNVYYNNSFCGYLQKGFDIAVDDAVAPANLSVKGDLITLSEAGNIQIFNAAGILITSLSNVTEVSTSGLAAGVYIAVSGNESVSFVK